MAAKYRRTLSSLPTACALVALALVFTCIAAFVAPQAAIAAELPDVIHATTDKDAFASSSMPSLTGDIHNLGGTNPVTGGTYSSYATAWRTQEGFMGYCISTLDNHHTPADGTFLTYRKNRAIDPELGYILRHGYPFTNTIGGVTFGDQDARLVTQFAFWLITDENFNADSGSAWKTGTAVPAARVLVAEARANAQAEAARNRFWVYSTSDGDGYQDLVLGVETTGGLKLAKASTDEGTSAGNPCYSLAGAVYGVYSGEACEESQLQARLTCDESGNAEAGDLVSGTYWVREISPAKGYALDETVYAVEVPAGDVALLTVADEPQTCRVEVAVEKLDAESGLASPTAGTTLEGAVFSIDFYAGDYELGNLPEEADRSWKVTTGADGRALLNEDLPLGTVVVRETEAPKGYLLNEEPHLVRITSEGTTARVQTYAAPQVKDEPMRSDLSFIKADEDTQRRMANVAFKLTEVVSGESHVIVTDENGCFDSTANPHSANTNANDAALGGDGTIDSSKLDGSAGVWFGTGEANDARGALPYGSYELQELRCDANKGHRLISATLSVSRNNRTYRLGTFDNKQVSIGTTLTYGAAEKLCPAQAEVTLVDEVRFENLERGRTYRLEGELHLVDAEGTDQGVIATGKVEFRPSLSGSTQSMEFSVSTSELAGCRLVAFERLYDGDDLLASHADLSDEGQTVRVPRIGTTLSGDSGHEAHSKAGSTIRLVDTVAYEGLKVGETYEVTGTLHLKGADGADGGVVRDASGADVTATARLTPSEANGTCEVVFEFTDPGLAGTTVVAFESVRHNGVELAVHADISDEGQTVSYPAVHTTASSKATGDHDAARASEQVVVDRVSLANLTVGNEYQLKGTLHLRGADGGDDGPVAEMSKDFVAESTEMSVEMEFTVDASQLGGRTLVVFEDLLSKDVVVASHADLNDEGQSVYVPDVHTTLGSAKGGEKELYAATQGDGTAMVELVDVVAYENLIPGKQYELAGELRLKAEDGTDAGALTNAKGAAVTAKASFTPDAASGQVEVTFKFDASKLAGKSVVAFETLTRDGIELAAHADIADAGQTVRFLSPSDKPALPQTGDDLLAPAAFAILGGLFVFVSWSIHHASKLRS